MTWMVRHATLIYLPVFTGLCLWVQHATRAHGADLGLTNDEASHFVNSLLILDFLRDSPFAGFMRFAVDYYEHFPRVSIGHWPPLYYLIQSGVLALLGRGVSSLLCFQAVTAGLASAVAGGVACRRQGFLVGLAVGLMVLCSPLLLFQVNAVMIDIFLGLLVLLAALAWARFARTGSLGWAMAFAALAAVAILSKGNAFGLALLPPLYCLFRRDFSLLASRKTWLAALAVGCATLPWYLLTYGMSSDGFVYAWGWRYTRLALGTYALELALALGPAGVAAMLAGAAAILGSGAAGLDQAPEPGSADRALPPGSGPAGRDETLASLLAASVAMFLFQCLVPTDIEGRYLIAIVPAGAILAAHGVGWAMDRCVGAFAGWPAGRARPAFRAGLAPALVALLLALNAVAIFRFPSVSTFHMDQLMRAILDSDNRNPLALVAGCPRAEGALIAAFAQADTARGHYVIRGFKALASDNFMGTCYRVRFSSTRDLAAWLAESGIGWVVVDTSPESLASPHTRQVLDFLDAGPPGWKRCAALPHGDGETRLYASDQPGPSAESIQALLVQVMPDKVLGKSRTWIGDKACP